NRERAVGRREPAIYRRMQENLGDLVGREAIAESGADVHRDLVLGPQRDQRGEGDRTARPAVQTGPGPGSAPGVTGDELLKRGPEIARRGGGSVDVLVAQDLAP